MKQIEALEIWNNGTSKTAHFLQVIGVYDNYESTSTQSWSLFALVQNEQGEDVAGEQLSQGNLTVSGQDYIDWADTTSPNVNAWIYNWVAEQLNLVII
jgi:hypothetical protein